MPLDKLLLQAARITWRQRWLWILGLLATAGGMLLNLFLHSATQARPLGGLKLDEFDPARALERVTSPSTLVGGILLLFLVVATFWLTSAIADGGLIVGVRRIQAGRPPGPVDTLSAGLNLIGRFIGIDTVLFLPLFLLAVALMLVGMVGMTGLVFAATRPGAQMSDLLFVIGLSIAVSVPIVLLMVIAGAIVLVLRSLAFRAAAIEGLNTGQSIKRSWRLLRKKLLPITLLTLVLWALRSVVGMPLRLITLALMAAGLGQYILAASNVARGAGEFDWLLALGGVIVALLYGMLAGIMHAYGSVSWTLAYGHWINEPA